jgi:UDP-galactopyranose mutase
MKYAIVGGGLTGCVLANLLKDCTIYEKDGIGGLCKDNDNYQEFVHILHTDNKEVWDYIKQFTTIRPHQTILKSNIDGRIYPYPPKDLDEWIWDNQYWGYSKKMWLRDTPKEAMKRIIASKDGLIFHDKYEGIPNFSELFRNMTKDIPVIKMDVKDGNLTEEKIILTGAIDEYFGYCYGKLPYRGMQSVHYKSEIGLDGDFVTFSSLKIPFQRLVDYGRLGYKDTWIGVESACDAKHYPIRDEEREKLYNKYKKLADIKGILLCGRLATYHYMDMDECIEQAFELVRSINENINSSK